MKKWKIGLLLLLLIFSGRSFAQISVGEYKTAFIERFTRFVQWPETLPSNTADSVFLIVVAGNNSYSNNFKILFSQIKIHEKEVKLVYSNKPEEIPNANLLFICGSEDRNLNKIIDAVNYKPILTISDTKGFSERGVHINRYEIEKFIRYEINILALERSGLKVNSLLLASARIINEKE